jgi:hypothetical protein
MVGHVVDCVVTGMSAASDGTVMLTLRAERCTLRHACVFGKLLELRARRSDAEIVRWLATRRVSVVVERNCITWMRTLPQCPTKRRPVESLRPVGKTELSRRTTSREDVRRGAVRHLRNCDVIAITEQRGGQVLLTIQTIQGRSSAITEYRCESRELLGLRSQWSDDYILGWLSIRRPDLWISGGTVMRMDIPEGPCDAQEPVLT